MRKGLLLLSSLLLIVASCAGGSGKKHRIGISIPAADHGWTGGIVWWANKTVKDLKAKNVDSDFFVITADTPARQVGDVEDLVSKGIELLVILPHESAPLTPAVKAAHKKGVLVVVVDRGLTEEFGYVNLAGDNAAFGRLSAEWLAKEMGGKGNLVCLEGLPVQINTERVRAFTDEIKRHPGIKLLDSQLANWSTQKGLEVMENYLQKYKQLDAVFAQDDDVLKGVLQAYRESKRTDIKTMLGGAGAKEVYKKIMDGDPLVRATVTYNPSMIRDAIRYAVDVVTGAKPKDFHSAVKPLRVTVPSVLVTKENVKDFYEPESVY